MLKYEIDSLEGLDESLHSLYTKGDDGKFQLAIDGLPAQGAGGEDVAGLKRKVSELLDEKKKAEKAKRDADEAARRAADEAARKAGDVTALERSWQEKLTATENEWKGKYESERGHVQNLLVESVASAMASELAISGSAGVLTPHIRNRLTVEYVDGKPATRVLDAKGQPSAATLDELKTEFAGNAAFAPIIAATKASGGGAGGGGAGAGGAKLKRSEMNADQKLEFIQKNGQKAFLQLPQ